MAINTTVCTRCHGAGEYSYNLKDGTVCYGCGGTGQVVTASKKQKKVKPTCTSIHKAVVGDILEVSCILYRVEEIKWIPYSIKQGMLSAPSKESNQQIKVIRLVDNKIYYFRRAVCDSEGFAIKTPEEWIGKDVIGKGIAE